MISLSRRVNLKKELGRLITASKIGSYDISLDCEGLSHCDMEIADAINEVIHNYRLANKNMFMNFKIANDW